MNQIISILKASNRRMDMILKGQYDTQKIADAQKEAQIQLKAVNIVVQAYAVASKNKRTILGLEKMNILDEHTAADLGLGDLEVDKIKCPEKEGLIIRQDCLDFSGKEENYEMCKGCEHFSTTRRLLIDENKEPHEE